MTQRKGNTLDLIGKKSPEINIPYKAQNQVEKDQNN